MFIRSSSLSEDSSSGSFVLGGMAGFLFLAVAVEVFFFVKVGFKSKDLPLFLFCLAVSFSSASAFFTGVSVSIAVFLLLRPPLLASLRGGALGNGLTCSGVNCFGGDLCGTCLPEAIGVIDTP